MKKWFLIAMPILLAACTKAFVAPTEAATIPAPWTDTSGRHPQRAAYSALIEKYRQKGLPGISLLVRNASGTWYGATGKADIENDVPFAAGTVSKAASITKLFMGVLTFRMMEDSARTGIGYTALFQPITRWLPARVTDKLPNGKQITLGDCMRHETGIPDLIEQDAFYLAVTNEPNRKWKQEDLLSFIYNKEPLFKPGDTAIYSNTNTVLVSMVLEAAAGRQHSDLLRQYVLAPLQLTNTFYQPHDALPRYAAQGYFDLYNNNKLVNVSNLVTGSGNGYGGMYSNLFDLHRFADALLISKSFLQPRSLALMQSWSKTDPPNRYGYGIMLKFIERGVNAGIGHSGRDLGYTANLFYFPNKGVLHIFFINYGTDSKSNLRPVFNQFQEELLNLTLQ